MKDRDLTAAELAQLAVLAVIIPVLFYCTVTYIAGG